MESKGTLENYPLKIDWLVTDSFNPLHMILNVLVTSFMNEEVNYQCAWWATTPTIHTVAKEATVRYLHATVVHLGQTIGYTHAQALFGNLVRWPYSDEIFCVRRILYHPHWQEWLSEE